MRTKEIEKKVLTLQVSSLERDKRGESFILEKLQSTLVRERASLSEVKVMYAAARRNMVGLTELNKLKRDAIQYKQEKDKREDKKASSKAALDAKNAHTTLAHSLQEKTKDDDVLCREYAKKRMSKCQTSLD
jgi:hypothetical protein